MTLPELPGFTPHGAARRIYSRNLHLRPERMELPRPYRPSFAPARRRRQNKPRRPVARNNKEP